MSSLWADLRFALRMMAKSPGVTAVLVLTLALGVGASTTIFSVVNSIVLRPLPFHQPERLVRVYTEFAAPLNLRKFWVSVPELFDLQRGCRTCETVAAWSKGTAAIAGGDRPLRVPAAFASHGLLPALGVQPLLGRTFTADEDRPGDPSVVVISHSVWRRAFGNDPDIIGRAVRVDAIPVTVIGVMPEGFDFPDGAEAWVPLGADPASTRRGSHFLDVIARVVPGATVDTLRAELDALIRGWSDGRDDEHHDINPRGHPMIAMPLQGEVVGSLATSLWLLQGAVLFVLLIAVANVANLLLARSEARTREVAVRHALGATRGRLVRQLLTESLVLGAIGGGLGVLVAVWALDAIIALIPPSAPRVREISLDGTALLFALACTVASSLLFGLAPILHTRRGGIYGALKEGGPRTTGSPASLQVRRALVIAEIALAVVLVIGCGVMVRSFVRLQEVDLGFRPDHLLVFGLELPKKSYPDDDAVLGFWQRVQDRMRGLPGATAATLVSGVPPVRPINANDINFPGRTRTHEGPPWNVDYWQIVGDDFVTTLGARIVRGRDLTRADALGTPSVLLVNEAFAAKFFPGEDPIGKQVQVHDERNPPQTIVGIVRDLKQAGMDRPAGSEVFLPSAQLPQVANEAERTMTVVVRTAVEPSLLASAIHRAIAQLDPSLPIYRMRTMDHVLWEAVARPRFLTFLLGAFAGIALLLAAVGIYGVMAYAVALRTHEIGIRMALGARPETVRSMVLRQAGFLAVVGVAVGLAATTTLRLGLDLTLAGLFYGGGLGDPVVISAVSLVVLATALAASWWPARRATRVEPTVALRAE